MVIGMIGAFLFILIMSMFLYPYSLDGDRDDRSMSMFVYPYSLDGDRYSFSSCLCLSILTAWMVIDDRSVPIHSHHVYVCLSLQLGW